MRRLVPNKPVNHSRVLVSVRALADSRVGEVLQPRPLARRRLRTCATRLVFGIGLFIVGTALVLAEQSVVSEAIWLVQVEKFAAARELLVPYVETNPLDLSAQYWLGRAYLAAGQLPAAIKVFRGVLAQKPSSVDTRLWLAKALSEDGQTEAARGELVKVITVCPNDPIATKLAAQLLAPGGQKPPGTAGQLPPTKATEKGGVRLITGGLPIEPGSIDIYSANVYDYTFGCAPVDWLVTNGRWESTNRWTCQPQWSWYGGYNRNGPAAIWNKREFAGDLVVELYSAFKMGFDIKGRNYKNPNDVSITICGDGANLDSGYTFMVGGQHNTTTRIMKGTKILAETNDLAALFPLFENSHPIAYDFHRKWWGIIARKRGAQLQLYVDNKLACEAEDPQPLSRGRVAVWTYDNGIIIPRIKLYYEREIQPRSQPAGQEALVVPQPTVAASVVEISCSSHPAMYNDFENSLGTWKNRGGSDGALLTVSPGGPTGNGHCLRLINQQSGGVFAASILQGKFDVAKFAKLSFDYKLNADVKANLYLTVAGQLYEIIFSGRSQPAPLAQILGRMEGVKADNRWHHAEFDLLGHLQIALGRTDNIAAKDLFIGNLNDTDYLLAGFGGNHAGTSYYLDNFVLASPSASKTVKLTLRTMGETQPLGYAISLDDRLLAPPEERVTTKSAEVEIETPGAGRWYVHVRPKVSEDQWGPLINYPVWVDNQGPRLVQSSPPEGPLGDQLVEIEFAEPGGAGLDLSTLKLHINGQDYDWTSPGIGYQPGAERLVINPPLLGVDSDDDTRLSLAIDAQDRAGNPMLQPLALTWILSPAADKAGPRITDLTVGGGYLCHHDFEEDVDSFTAYGGDESARLFRDDSTAASGRYSLKVYNPTEAGRFGIYIYKQPFDAGKYRLVAFDYKVPSRLRADFAVFVNGDWKGIKFTDVDDRFGYIGQVPGVIADNQWHHTEFDLYQMLRQDDPDAANYIVNQFVLADWGWLGNARGQTYHLDNFAIIPVLSGSNPIPVAWKALDISGISGVSWHLDSTRTSHPPRNVMAESSPGQLTDTAEFNGWMHFSVQDGAGHWSPTHHRRLLVDSRPPRASPLSPAPEGPAADSEVKIALLDDGKAGVDPTSIVLSIGGTDYRVENRGLRYDSEQRVLVWNCEKVRPQPVVFKDGQQVQVMLKQAADFADNPLSQPLAWSWIMNYAQDSKPPVSTIQSQSHPTFMANTFEDGLGMVKGGNTVVEVDDSTSASGNYSLKLTKPQGGQLRATICPISYRPDKHPIIAFDYRIPAGTKVSLLAQTGDKWYGFAITGKPDQMLGRVPNIVADDQWHHASINIAELLRRRQRRGPIVVNQLVISDRSPSANSTGAVAHFDNFMIGRTGTGPPTFSWMATDATGITGYSYALDPQPNNVPDSISQGLATKHAFAGVKPGVWFFHLRAQDGAGNWGPPVHYAILHGSQ